MKVFCILSDERAHRSFSPAMHTAVLRRVGIDGVYVPFAVEASTLPDAIRGLKALGIAGANVTVPYKEKVIPLLEECSEEAAAIGAVNTLVHADGKLIGHNTDADGFIEALKTMPEDAGAGPILVVGTGGAARAAIHALTRMNAGPIEITGRDATRAEALAREFSGTSIALAELPNQPRKHSLVVNTTSVSSPSESPELDGLVAATELSACRFMFDINYGRMDNLWHRKALQLGVPFMDGLPMLAAQARESFRLWTGMELDVQFFEDALKDPL